MNYKKQSIFILAYFLTIIDIFNINNSLLADENSLFGADSSTILYDTATQKYFIGGKTKFMIRQAEGSSLIDRIEVSIDGANYVPYKGALDFSTEGKHSIKFRAINPVNNWSPVQFTEVFVDLTPPSTEVNFADGKSYKDGQTTYAALNSILTLFSQDNLSGVAQIEYAWDNPNSFIPYVKPIVVDKLGNRVLYYRATDRVGNLESYKKLEFIADGKPPSTDMTTEGGALRPAIIRGNTYLTASDSVAYKLTAKDSQSGVKNIYVGIDGYPATPYLKPIYFLKEGPHQLTYYAVDNVSNKEEAKTVSLYTISNPPRTVATPIGTVVKSGGLNYARGNLKLRLDAEDNVVGLDRIEYKFDNDENYSVYINPIQFKTQGFHTVYFRSVDRTGNTEAWKTYSVNISETPPETTLETAQPLVVREGITYSPTPNVVTLTVKNFGVGVDQTYYSVNDEPFKPYHGPFNLLPTSKVVKISYHSIDKLGNEEQVKEVSFRLIGNLPLVDLFISNDRNKEEQIRTSYFEDASNTNPTREGGSNKNYPSSPTAPAMARTTNNQNNFESTTVPSFLKPDATERTYISNEGNKYNPSYNAPNTPQRALASEPTQGGGQFYAPSQNQPQNQNQMQQGGFGMKENQINPFQAQQEAPKQNMFPSAMGNDEINGGFNGRSNPNTNTTSSNNSNNSNNTISNGGLQNGGRQAYFPSAVEAARNVNNAPNNQQNNSSGPYGGEPGQKQQDMEQPNSFMNNNSNEPPMPSRGP